MLRLQTTISLYNILHCPKCGPELVKYEKVGESLMCPLCGYVSPFEAPASNTFKVLESQLEAEIESNDAMCLLKRHQTNKEKDGKSALAEYIAEVFLPELPFIGAPTIEKYVFKAHYTIEAIKRET